MWGSFGAVLFVYVLLRFMRLFIAMCKTADAPPPRRIGAFYVTSAAGEQHVRLFYAWLNRGDEMQDLCVGENNNTDVIVNLRMLNSLYHQEDMWVRLERDGEAHPVVQQWMLLLHALFIAQLTSSVKSAGGKIEDACTVLLHLFHYFIRFSNVYMHPKFPIARHHPLFLRTVLRVALTCSADLGFLPGFLLFAHLCPELVTDDCYPVLNNDTHIYQRVIDVWDVEQLSPVYAYLIYKYEAFVNL